MTLSIRKPNRKCSLCSLGREHVVKGLKSSWRHLILHKQSFAIERIEKQKTSLTGSLSLMMLLRRTEPSDVSED